MKKATTFRPLMGVIFMASATLASAISPLSNYNAIANAFPGADLVAASPVATNIAGVTITHSTSGDVPANFAAISGLVPDIQHMAFHQPNGTVATPATTSFIFDFSTPISNLVHAVGDIDNTAAGSLEIVQVEAFLGAVAVPSASVAFGASIIASGPTSSPTTTYTAVANTSGNETDPAITVTSSFSSPVDRIIVTVTANGILGTVSTFAKGNLPAVVIPTLSDWMLMLLATALLLLAVRTGFRIKQ